LNNEIKKEKKFGRTEQNFDQIIKMANNSNSIAEEAEDFHSKISFILPSPWYFQSHTAPVNSIATVNSNEIFTGSRDGTIRQFKRTNSPLLETNVKQM